MGKDPEKKGGNLMHYHCEVWLKDSSKYKGKVMEIMTPHNSEHGGSLYDWCVIGGRWSGEHTIWKLSEVYGKRVLSAISEEFDKKYGWWTSKENSREKRRKEMEEVFFKHIPKEEYRKINPDLSIPYWRDNYELFGEQDDIIPLSEVPLDKVSCYTFIIEDSIYEHQRWTGKTFEETPFNIKDILAEKGIRQNEGYLVTIDYHN